MRGTAVHLPTPVDWVLWDGNNFDEVSDFVREREHGGTVTWQPVKNGSGYLVLHTMQGDRWPQIGDRITRGVEDELYMVPPSRWAKLYGSVVTTGG